jgi:hypothetical protein
MGKKAERAKSIGSGDNNHVFMRETVAPVQGCEFLAGVQRLR